MEIVYDEEAREETLSAATYYEGCCDGLGRLFLASIEGALIQIKNHPETWHRIKGRFRRYLVHGFPYGIIYTINGENIEIIAVSNLHRIPFYWADRIKILKDR